MCRVDKVSVRYSDQIHYISVASLCWLSIWRNKLYALPAADSNMETTCTFQNTTYFNAEKSSVAQLLTEYCKAQRQCL